MARYYASADIGLALSGWETFGLSILESMACGNAQVAANSGAAAEHIRKSSAGLLLKRRSANELADKITQLLSELNPDLKQSARQYAEKYSWKACFERQLNLYREIAQTSNHQRGIL
jgi:alpha-1,6-mannosyltransferase